MLVLERAAMSASPSKYRVLHELGAGGMGRIFKGLLVGQAGFQRPVVIKRLRYANDANLVRLFVQEARRYAVLDHENIGRIFDFEEVGGELSIIMEYIDGWSLVDYLEQHRRAGRMPDVEMTVFIISRVCRALQYVLERATIVHRDVSPSNIMMTRQGTVKLIDFGIATRIGTTDINLTGKPAYMAPEMILERRADHRSDIFSMGVVFYEMLTLKRLFGGSQAGDVLQRILSEERISPRAGNPLIPEAVEAVVQKALAYDPLDRYHSAAEMGEACEHLLYDKGYGPTNLTLKQYLVELFQVDPNASSVADENPTPVSSDSRPVPGLPLASTSNQEITRASNDPSRPRKRRVRIRNS
jgi:serine/threonine protein kinase